MDSQNEEGTEKIIHSTKANAPIAARMPVIIKANDTTTTISGAFMDRHGRKLVWAAILTSIAATIAVLGTLTEIPNNMMNWYINWKKVSEKGSNSVTLVEAPSKPLPDRLSVFLMSVNPLVFEDLKNGTTNFDFWLSQYQLGKLQEMAAEPGADSFIRIESALTTFATDTGMRTETKFILSTNLLFAR